MWRGDALRGTGLPRTGDPGAESTLDRESRDDDREPNESVLANSAICRKSHFSVMKSNKDKHFSCFMLKYCCVFQIVCGQHKYKI